LLYLRNKDQTNCNFLSEFILIIYPL